MEQSPTQFVFDNIHIANTLCDILSELTTLRYNTLKSLVRLYYKLAYLEVKDVISLLSNSSVNYRPNKVPDIPEALDNLYTTFEKYYKNAPTIELGIIYKTSKEKIKTALIAFVNAKMQEERTDD